MKARKFCIKKLGYAFICLLLIGTIFHLVKCTRTYSVYSENYRDTVYVEPPGDYKRVYMNGIPTGTIQNGYYGDDEGEFYMVIRRFDNSKLDTFQIGYKDWNDLENGDTIINGNPLIAHDTITISDTVHIENNNGIHKAYVFPGVKTSIVVEKGYLMNNNIDDKEYIRHSCVVTLRTLDNSQLCDIKVGIHDYERLNLGDTIYEK